MKSTLITLIHPENLRAVLMALGSLLIALAAYTGTLPASLQAHKDWIELGAFLVTALNLVHVDPKRELPK